MNLLQDVITYVRRIVKTQSDTGLTDNLIIDYINRFWTIDVDARIQLFDLKTTYRFQTSPGIDKYNMPLYSLQVQPGAQTISYYPVYQGFLDPCYVNGIQTSFHTMRDTFYNLWPNYLQVLNIAAVGTGIMDDVYTVNLPYFPAIPGHVDMAGIIASGQNVDPPISNNLLVPAGPPVAPYNGNSVIPNTSVYSGVFFNALNSVGANVVVQDSGQFLTGNQGYGLLMNQQAAPYGCSPLPGGYSATLNTVNYANGTATFSFPAGTIIPLGNDISASCYFYNQGIPRAILYYNNVITVRPPPNPNTAYLIELDAYLTPAAFLSTSNAVPFAYMSEYIARGAARKILSDTGDVEQFNFYEPLFKEQETLVWKRSQRQFTANRIPTIFSTGQGLSNSNNLGIGTT